MELGLAGASVVVTGAGANIGRGIAHVLAGEGARLLLVDIDHDGVERVAVESLDRGATAAVPLTADLTVDGVGRRIVDRAVQEWGRLDAMINNAGWSAPGWFAEQTDRELWQRTVDINLFAAIDCAQAALTPMRAQGGGAVVFLSSDAAFGAIRQGVYGGTKAALISIARTIARENGRYGVRANVVAPGLVVPPDDVPVGEHSVWAAGRDALFTADQVASVVATQALRRLTTPQDVGHAVAWLCSETAARQVTGQVIAVGGGSSMP